LWCPADVISSNRGIGSVHSEIPDADLSHPSVQDVWQRLMLSKNFPKTESIGITGFGKSRILETRSPEHIKSRIREERSRPSICWDVWRRSAQSGKSRKEHAISKSEIGESRSQKNSSSELAKSQFAISR
jgi:hypothetical protein